ncbi:peptidase S10 [Sphingomonas ginkgonis]|uniref:Peptidase S10 n=1 Tax=Sphingomonas ginkgonis TaxID=2315330 RepID=A0A3S0EKP4_9SPHN|nr:peptidase S10 [Sphingomonas ginkgonis]RST29847.1 peptidase S10 [Sphingomonas ginkgonis]
MNSLRIASLLLLLGSSAALAQSASNAGDAPPPGTHQDAANKEKGRGEGDSDENAKASAVETEQPVKRSITLRGGRLAYTVTTGTLTIRNDDGEATASMFYTAYTMPSRDGRPRPVTFLFNGGPGSSTMWLHMGSVGPMKVDASIPETIAGPPFRVSPNPDTLLDRSDLVFLDAVTTGLSRPVGKAKPEDFFGVDKDLDAFSRGIQRYLTKYGRWNSPKFIIGESYGTLRAAGLSSRLADKGVQLNGIVLVSTVLNFADFAGDQQYINFMPTYAADAWYHGKVAHEGDLDGFAARARAFAMGPYAAALQKGGAISDAEKQSVAQQMAALTGLSADYVLRTNLRVDPERFRRELLRDRRQIIGRIDSRYLGTEAEQVGSDPTYDPQSSAITGGFSGAINDYLFRDLGFKTPLSYRINNYAGIGGKWEFTHRSSQGEQSVADTSVDLADTMRQNPRMKLLSVNGYYDLATPFYGADYEIGHMALEPRIAANVRYVYYPSGHMVYIDPVSARRLKADLASFYDSAM